MKLRRDFRYSKLGLILSLCVSLFAQGCSEKPAIRSYVVPKYQEEEPEPEQGPPKYRVFGAIAPADDSGNNWFFFKLRPVGGGISAALSPEEVALHEMEVREFLASLKFPEGQNPTWTVPKSWSLGPVREGRIATFLMKKSQTEVELSITRFGGSLLSNVNRWRTNDAGVEPLTEADLAKQTETLTSADGKPITLVSVFGNGPKGGPKQPPFAPQK